jgi:hypothetical protein
MAADVARTADDENRGHSVIPALNMS